MKAAAVHSVFLRQSAVRFFALATLCIAALYLGMLFVCQKGHIADGYDGIGFVLAVHDFDLSRYQPQPPGYPLFVAMGRALSYFGLRPALALAITNALLLSVGLGALGGLIRAVSGGLAGWIFLLLVPSAPLVCGLGMATLSDGAGVGLALLATALSGWRRHSAIVGVIAGLAVGMRPPILPLLVLLLLPLYTAALRERAIGWAGVGALFGAFFATVLLWLVPLAYCVGPRVLIGLTLSHAQGHFADFGGSALAETAPLVRLFGLVRGLGEGMFGRCGWLLLPGGLLCCFSLARQARFSLADASLAEGRLRQLLHGLFGAFWGYALWAFFALPVASHGRHLLPLVVLLGALLALALPRYAFLPGFRAALLLLLTLLAGANLSAAHAFRKTPPPGAALAAYILDRAERTGTWPRLYGARAARYLDLELGSGSARPAVYLGEVLADLERADRLPAEVLVTSEVLASPRSRPRLLPLARFCYPDKVLPVLRFDRAPQRGPAFAGNTHFGDCVELFSYRVGP